MRRIKKLKKDYQNLVEEFDNIDSNCLENFLRDQIDNLEDQIIILEAIINEYENEIKKRK